MRQRAVAQVLRLVAKQCGAFQDPSVTEISRVQDPFRVLIACILSLRTKDETTRAASERLFRRAATPRAMLRIPAREVERLIYPVGFYRNKARVILGICRRLIDEFGSMVPDTEETLLGFRGVGRKTANLVLGLGFGKPAICVDTHVHRISNRLGWVRTRTPEETERTLKGIVPRSSWIKLNTLFVAFGQNICQPVSPFCSRCSVYRFCKRRGVVRQR